MFFRITSILLITACLFYVLTKLRQSKIGLRTVWDFFKIDFKENLVIPYRVKSGNAFRKVKSIIIHLTIFLFFILFITGFIPVFFGFAISGLFLMIHVQAALLLSVCLVGLVILFSNQNQISLDEFHQLRFLVHQKKEIDFALAYKFLYWLIVSLSIPMMLSIILMLFPIFNTNGLEFLADVHRISVLLITISVIFVIYFRTKEKLLLNQ